MSPNVTKLSTFSRSTAKAFLPHFSVKQEITSISLHNLVRQIERAFAPLSQKIIRAMTRRGNN